MHKLKLRALDQDDLTVFSAYLQDALVVTEDIAYDPKHRDFTMMLNRYIWEDDISAPESRENDMGATPSILDEEDRTTQTPQCHRIRTAIHFKNIMAVKSQNIPQSLKDHTLELLAIESHPLDDQQFDIDFIFSGDERLRLKAEVIEGLLQDIGEHWQVKCQPSHKVLNGTSSSS